VNSRSFRCKSVYLSSVSNVRAPYSAIILRHLVHWPSVDIQEKNYGDSLRPGGEGG